MCTVIAITDDGHEYWDRSSDKVWRRTHREMRDSWGERGAARLESVMRDCLRYYEDSGSTASERAQEIEFCYNVCRYHGWDTVWLVRLKLEQ